MSSADHTVKSMNLRKNIPWDVVLDRNALSSFQVLIVAAVAIVLMIDGLDVQLIALMALNIIVEFGANPADFGPALAGALLGMALGAGIGGFIGDRVGRLNALVCSAVVFGAATTLVGQTKDVLSMTALRIVSGLGFGAAGPNGIAFVTGWLSARHRSQAITMPSVSLPAGGLAGATVVLLLLPWAGWRAKFLICASATVAFAALMRIILQGAPSCLLAHGKTDELRRHCGE